jgi:RNase adaptor protein for sRNA GlmZ degradation
MNDPRRTRLVSVAVRPEPARRRLTLVTFGFKYGPPGTNYYFDVSFLRNPAREQQWSLFDEPSPAMRSFVLDQPQCREFLANVTPLIRTLVECDEDVRIGIGCSAGRHRSRILADELARMLADDGLDVHVVHREDAYR